MKRFLLLLIIMTLGFQSLWSQRVTVSERIPLKANDRYELLGTAGEHILLFLDKRNAFELEAYDHSLNFLWNQRITFGDKEVRMAGVENSNDHIHIFYYYRGDETVNLRYAQYDAGMNLTDSLQIASLEKEMFLPDIYFTTSENRNKAIIFYSRESKEMTAHVVDLINGKKVWGQTFTFAKDIQNDFRRMVMTDQGEMILVMERNNRRFGRKKHRFDLYYYHRGLTEYTIHSIPFSDHLVHETTFTFDNQNRRLIGGGLYATKSNNQAEGAFMVSHQFPNGQANKELFPFNPQLIEDLTSDEATGDDHINDITAQDIFLRRDGGMLLVSEIERIYKRGPNYGESSFYRSYSGSNWVDYYYEDLVLTSFHPNGEKHWSSVLHKRQYSQDDEGRYSSYFSFVTPSRLRFIFNDEISKNSTVSEYILWGNGYHERKSVMSTYYQQLQLRFKKGVQLNSTSLLVPSEVRDAMKLVKIDLADWKQ